MKYKGEINYNKLMKRRKNASNKENPLADRF